MDIFNLDHKYITPVYSRFPVAIKSGKGSIAVGSDGKEYIDLAAGIAVNTFGIADNSWIEAVTNQANQLQHTSNLYYTEPAVLLAKELCERSNMEQVFFSNSGAEANECMIKAARQYFAENHPERTEILTLTNSFHGRTLATLAATGQPKFHEHFLPLPEGFVYTDPNLTDIEAKLEAGTIGAIMLEVVQGEGGVNLLSEELLTGIARICQEQDILLLIDEIQTGNGRTGKLFAYEHFNLEPDLITTAKGLAGGLPLGATLFGEKVKDILGPGMHGSTFGGNPICCAAGLNVLERLTDDLLESVSKKGNLIQATLENVPGVLAVEGLGLMRGITTEKPAAEVVQDCLEHGVLVIQAQHKIRLLPALNIPEDLLTKALEILKQAIKPN